MWARNVVLMGPTFLSSGLSTGLSAVSFVLHLGGWGEKRTLEALRRAERVSLLIEGGLIAASLIRMGRWGKPLYSGKLAPLFVGGTILGGIVAPFALLSGRESRPRGMLDRKGVVQGKSVDLGGRRLIKKKITHLQSTHLN